MPREELRELSLFALLVAIVVAGRWAEPMWNFTPLTAVAALGGFCLRRRALAWCLPVVALGLSNVVLPSYQSWPVCAAVMAMLTLPVWLGSVARNATGGWKLGCAVVAGVAPACAFFVVTNLFVWAFTSLYSHDLDGLAQCYVAGMPFYRNMLLGDVCYVILFAACICLAGVPAATATEKVRRSDS